MFKSITTVFLTMGHLHCFGQEDMITKASYYDNGDLKRSTLIKNNDHWDEIIYLMNTIDPVTYESANQFRVIDLHRDTTYMIGGVRIGANFSSTPSLVDLDGDKKLEIVFCYSQPLSSKEEYSIVECINLDEWCESISFPGYLGTGENGVFTVKQMLE